MTILAAVGPQPPGDTLDAAATLTRPSQVELYTRAFERLSQQAARGAAVRALIADAVASLH